MRERLALFGGAFNPPHYGHLRPVLEAKRILGLERILFLPAGQHPFKPGGVLAPVAQRVEMVRLALLDQPGCELCTLETERGGVSYTIDTLRRVAALYPDAERFFLLGADLLAELHLWRDWRALIEQAHLAVMLRPGGEAHVAGTEAARYLQQWRVAEPEALSFERQGRWGFAVLPVTPLGISSTQVRAGVARGEELSGLLPVRVWDYIREHRLYRGRDG